MAQDVIEGLEALVAAGAIKDFDKGTSSSGNKTVWTIVLPVPDDPESWDDLQLETAPARAFLRGTEVGRTMRKRRGGTRKPNPWREAIERGEDVVVDLPDDPNKAKSVRNGIFAAAYQLGLKGQFSVKKEGDKLVGRRKDA